MMTDTKRILLLEDEERWQIKVYKAIAPLQYDVDIAGDVKTAKELIEDHRYHLLVIDLSMIMGDRTDEQGLDFIENVRKTEWGRTAKVLIITSYPTLERMRRAFAKYKIEDFYLKADWSRDEFQEKVVAVLSNPIENLIRAGESETLEFKATLRWNIHKKQRDRAMGHAYLKTIAAFLNTKGGTLLIGVSDDGTITGTKADGFQNADKMMLHLTDLVKQRIGTRFMEFIDLSVETVGDHQVFRVDCKPSPDPAYLHDGKEEHFYVRTGPSTEVLPASQIYNYIEHHFRS